MGGAPRFHEAALRPWTWSRLSRLVRPVSDLSDLPALSRLHRDLTFRGKPSY